MTDAGVPTDQNQLHRAHVRARGSQATRRAGLALRDQFDGYRCLAGKDAGGVSLWSRRGNDFTSQFPAIAKACEYLPVGTLVDGEIVATGRQRANLVQPDAASSV